MAKAEFRKPIQALMEQKERLVAQMTNFTNEYNLNADTLAKYRADEMSYRQSLEALPKTAQHVPARRVFDLALGDVRRQIEEVSKIIEGVENKRQALQTQINSLTSSIRELDGGR